MSKTNHAAEDTMNAYLADRIAREHADALMADAAAHRRARRARQERKERRAATRTGTVSMSGLENPRPQVGAPKANRWSNRAASAAHLAARPYTALHDWIAAGQL
jgi:hypothetical protein